MPALARSKQSRWVLGVTGGIACGKSTVLAELNRLGVATISSDEIAHEIIRHGTPVYRAIVRRYGPSIVGRSGEIDRSALGSIVFRDPRELRWLERQIHPMVRRRLRQFVLANRGLIALDIPLLFERGLEWLVDGVAVVFCTKKQQVQRLRKNRGLSALEARRRIRAQMPLPQKKRRATYLLNNGSTVAALKRQVRDLVQRIKTDPLKSY